MIKYILFSFCEWSDTMIVGHAIRESTWLFPFTEIFHLLALSVLGGAVLLVNMRLLGVPVLSKESVPQLAEEVWPLTVWSVMVMLISGYALFASEALKDFYSWGFRLKMASLMLAIIFTLTVHRKVSLAEEDSIAPVWRKVTAIVSLLLWLTVGLGGRSIGYITGYTS
jgi:hypothetical protein